MLQLVSGVFRHLLPSSILLWKRILWRRLYATNYNISLKLSLSASILKQIYFMPGQAFEFFTCHNQYYKIIACYIFLSRSVGYKEQINKQSTTKGKNIFLRHLHSSEICMLLLRYPPFCSAKVNCISLSFFHILQSTKHCVTRQMWPSTPIPSLKIRKP